MSVNKLNLQIGGNKEEDDSLLKETGVNKDVDNLIAEMFYEGEIYPEEEPEEHGEYLVKAIEEVYPPDEKMLFESLKDVVVHKSQTPVESEEVEIKEPNHNRIERMSESISRYHKKTNQTLTEVAPVSDSDRIKLLEDAFAQMKRAQPNTLVSGIGASLDSGGGAVWLWDLEDVDIGTPLNGQYPVIAANSILKYNAATTKWVIGSSAESGEITTADVALVNQFSNVALSGELQSLPQPDGDLTSQEDANKWIVASLKDIDERIGGVDGNTDVPGNLDFEDTDADADIRRFGNSNPTLNIKVGALETELTTLATFTKTSTTFPTKTQYTGPITDDDDVATKKYVDDQIDLVNPSGNVAGVTKIIAGTNISISPENGEGEVTINSAGGGSGGGWSLDGETDLLGACDIELTESNNALRFIGSANANGMLRLKNVDDVVEFNAEADFNKGFHIATNQEITLDGGNISLNMRANQGNAFTLKDSDGNNFVIANTAGGDNLVFYTDILNSNDNARCKFSAFEPPPGSHFYLTTNDADSLDFIDETTNEIYLRFNTFGAKKSVQIVDADVDLDVTGIINCGTFETLDWYIRTNSGTGGSGHIFINDNDGDAFDIQNESIGNPHLRFRTTTDDQATLFYQPIRSSNGALVLGNDGKFTCTALTTLQGTVNFDPNQNQAFDFGAYDGSSARAMVRFNRRTANAAGQIDFAIRGYRPGETTVKDILTVVDNDVDDGVGDEILYYGDTSDNNAIQTKSSVQTLVAAGGGGITFTFKGSTDVTTTDPPSASAGDYYLNSTQGNAGANWTGISGQAVAANQMLIYTAASQWVTGAGATSFLPLGGGTMTGDITFNSGQQFSVDGIQDGTITQKGVVQLTGTYDDSNANSQVVAATPKALTQLRNLVVRKTGASGVGSMTGALNINVSSGDAYSVNDSDFAVDHNGAVSAASYSSTGDNAVGGNLSVIGTSALNGNSTVAGTLIVSQTFQTLANAEIGGTLNVTADSHFSNANVFGTLNVNNKATINTSGGASLTSITGSGNLTQGTVDTGVDSNFYGNIQLKSANSGVTDGKFVIKDISNVSNFVVFPTGVVETNGGITFKSTTNTTQTIQAYGKSGKTIKFNVSNDTSSPTYTTTMQTNTTSTNFINNNVVFNNLNVQFDGGTANVVKFKRPATKTTNQWWIEGTTTTDTSDITQTLLGVYRNTVGGANPDAVNYYGRTAGDTNIQTRQSTQQLILDQIALADANILSGGLIKNTGGSASTTGNLFMQATSTGGGFIYIQDSAQKTHITLNPSGNIVMGNQLTLGSTNLAQTTKVVQFYAASNPTVTIQTKSGTANPVDVFSFTYNKVQVATTFNIASSTTSSSPSIQFFTGGRMLNLGVDNTTYSWTTTRNAQLQFQGTTEDAAISKIGGRSSSNNNDYNRLYFFCGSSSNSSTSGVKNPMLTLINAAGTYIMMGPPGLRQEFDQDIATVGYVNTTTVMGTATTQSTQTSDPDSGETLNTVTQSHVSIPAQLTLDGRTTDGDGFLLLGKTVGSPSNSSAKLFQTSHNAANNAAKIEYFGDTSGANTIQTKSSVSDNFAGLDANNSFTGAQNQFLEELVLRKDLNLAGNANTQDIRASGTVNKGLNIKCNDSGGTLQAVAKFAVNSSIFYYPTDFNAQTITNIGAPSADTDAATKKYIDDLITGCAQLSGNNTFTGSSLTNTFNTNVEIGVNRMFTNNSVTYLNNILYLSQSAQQQKVRIRGANSKSVLFTAPDSGGNDVNVLTLGATEVLMGVPATISGAGGLTISNATENSGVIFNSSQTVQGLRAYGVADKALKVFVGPNENTSTQVIAFQKEMVTFGNPSTKSEITWNSSEQFQNFILSSTSVLNFKFGGTSGISISSDTVNKCPRIFMDDTQSARIQQLTDPVNAQDAATKNYVDTLKNYIKSALNSSSDYASFKSTLLGLIS